MENISRTENDTNSNEPVLGANVKISLYSIILILSLVGNVLVIAVVCGNKNLRTVFNSFIVNMAISDLFIPLLALPIGIVESANQKTFLWLIDGGFGNATCKFFTFLIDISPGVTVFSLVIIAVNRFIAIVKPMYHAELFSKKRCRILIAFTWIAVTIIFAPYFHICSTSVYKGYNKCDKEWRTPFDSRYSEATFFYILIVVFFVAPFASIIILYSVIIYKLHADSKTVVKMLDNEEALKRKRRNKHIFFLSVAMILAFAVFWGPFFVVLFIGLTTENNSSATVFFTVQFLGYSNSAINPLIYFIFLGTFRAGFKRLFFRRRESESNGAAIDTKSVIFTKDNVNDEKIKMTTMTSSV